MRFLRLYFKKNQKEFTLILIAALAQGMAFIATIFWGSGGFMWLSDSRGYLEIAKSFLAAKCFCLQPEWGPQSFRTPLYPLFIALFYWLANGIWLAIFIQNIVAAVNILLTYKLGKIIFGPRAGFLGALLLIFESARLELASQLMSETIFVFFLLLAVYFFIKSVQEDRRSYLVISAVSTGLAALTRPIIQFFFLGIILFFLVFGIARKNIKKCLLSALLFLVFFAVTVSPWLIRNYVHFDKWGLSGMGGYGFYATHSSTFLEYWLGLNGKKGAADVVGILNRKFSDHFGFNLWGDDAPSDDLRSGQVMGYPYDNYLFKEGLNIISLDPAFYAWVHVRRMGTFFSDSSASRSYGALLYELRPYLPSSIFYPYLYFGGRALRILYNLIILAAPVFFLWTFKKKIWENLFLIGTILYFVILSSMATDVGRYRQPIEPFFFLFLGNAIILFYDKFKNKVRKRQPEHENRKADFLRYKENKNYENRNCILCGNRNLKLLNRHGILEKCGEILEFNNVICKDCGLVFIDPQPETADYDNIYKKYEASRHHFQSKDEVLKMMQENPGKEKAAEVNDFLREYINNKSKFLDIGAGFGQISNNFKNIFGYNISAVEPSILLSEATRENFSLPAFSGDFDEFLKANNEKFNILLLHHVFEHFIDPLEKLAQFESILLPDGVVYIEIPNIIFFKKPVDHFFDYCHPFSYSPKVFKELIEKAGFKIIKLNKNKKYRLQAVIAPKSSQYEDLGSDSYWKRGGFFKTIFFIKKRKVLDAFKKYYVNWK